MKNFKRLLLLAVAASTCSLAQASSLYSASFGVTDGQLPRLRSEAPNPNDTRPTLPGSWLSGIDQTAIARVREVFDGPVDPVTGTATPVWGPERRDQNRFRNDDVGEGAVGSNVAFVEALPNLAPQDASSAGAVIFWGGVSAEVKKGDLPADVQASTSWFKNFLLDPRSSFTFSGIASLQASGDAAPLVLQNSALLYSEGTFASLTRSDAAGLMWASISAQVTGVLGIPTDIFSYQMGDDGMLSLTITNNTDGSLGGRLGIASYVGISANPTPPVPEPETVLMMLSGVGVVGWAKRKRDRTRDSIGA